MKGWNLDKELKVDAGVSSYGGDNVRKGALGEFINAVDCGLIKTPCVLILEQLDRLTRMKLRDARKLFESLLEKGVKICVSISGKIYDEASLDNPFDLFFSIMELSAAHEYAASIGRRSGAAWKRKKERTKTGEILTKTCPAWLRVTNKAFEVIPDRRKIVQNIFNDYVNGFGYRAIAKRLNTKAVPTFGTGKGWNTSYIQQILFSRAVIGDYQPYNCIGKKRIPSGEPVPNYFPAVVDLKTWQAAAARRLTTRKPSGKSTKKLNNLFAGILKCNRCGQSHTFIYNNGRIPAFVCYNATRGKCKFVSMHYNPFEKMVIYSIARELIPLLRENVNKPDREHGELLQKKEVCQRKLNALNNALQEGEGESPKTVLQTMTALENELEALNLLIEKKENEKGIDFDGYQKILLNLYAGEKNLADLDYRIRVRKVLNYVLERIVVDNANKTGIIYGKGEWFKPFKFSKDYADALTLDLPFQFKLLKTAKGGLIKVPLENMKGMSDKEAMENVNKAFENTVKHLGQRLV
jgi:DNA invertase Pin-like site-specific DNA recombinase